jgi:glyoxylase-like metal-dependent hydrolase (beta-lactamase superfamily II)
MEVIIDKSDLKIERLELSTFATNAYIIICPRTGKSALIDAPAGGPTILKYLKGTELECILLTHNHIDHIGGLQAIRNRNSASLSVHPADDAKWLPFPPDNYLKDGDIIHIGQIQIECLYTPGHTPGSVCFKIGEYLLCGDTIFPGGPGRTTGPSEFKQIEKSIIEEIFQLPDDTLIYPGHGGPTVLNKEKKEYAIFSSREHDPKLCGDVTWLNS